MFLTRAFLFANKMSQCRNSVSKICLNVFLREFSAITFFRKFWGKLWILRTRIICWNVEKHSWWAFWFDIDWPKLRETEISWRILATILFRLSMTENSWWHSAQNVWQMFQTRKDLLEQQQFFSNQSRRVFLPDNQQFCCLKQGNSEKNFLNNCSQ